MGGYGVKICMSMVIELYYWKEIEDVSCLKIDSLMTMCC